jgi:hypothetical protein
MDSGGNELVQKIEYIKFDELEEFSGNIDYELIYKECSVALDDPASTDWMAQYQGINTLRRINKYDGKFFEAVFEKVVYCVVKLCASIRSNISKLVLMLFSEIFYTHNFNTKNLKLIIPAVLVQSAHLKQFIKDESLNSLKHLSKCKSNTYDIILLLINDITNKNPTISENSLNCLIDFLKNCNLYDITQEDWVQMLLGIVQINALKKDIYTKKASKLLGLCSEILDDSFSMIVKKLGPENQSVINAMKRDLVAKASKISKPALKEVISKYK